MVLHTVEWPARLCHHEWGGVEVRGNESWCWCTWIVFWLHLLVLCEREWRVCAFLCGGFCTQLVTCIYAHLWWLQTDARQVGGKRQAPSDNQTPAHSCRPVHTGAISKWLASVTRQGLLLERFYCLMLGKRGGKSFVMTPSVCLAWDALVWMSPQHSHLPRIYRSSVYTTWRIGNAW